MTTLIDGRNNYNVGFTIISCTVIAILILIGASIPFFNIVALSFTCLIILFSNSTLKVVNILLFTLAFSTIFKLHPDSNTFFNVVLVVAIAKLYNKNFKFSYKEILTIFIFVVYVLIFGDSSSIFPLIKLCLSFILMIFIFKDKEDLDLRIILQFFSYGIILSSFAGLFCDFIPGLNSYINEIKFKVGEGEYISRFSGIELNPNFYTMDISIALAAWLAVFLGKQSKPIDFVYIITLSTFGIMSLSKSFLLTFVILLFLLLISIGKQKIRGLIKAITFIIIISIALYFFVDEEYISAFVSRFIDAGSFNTDLSTFTTGRYDIWLDYINYILNDIKTFWFGVGLGTEDYGDATHNYYLETVYYLGIIGAVLYSICIKSIFPIRKQHLNRGLVNYLPLIILLVRGMAINLILRENLIFYFIIIAVVLNTNIIENEKLKTNKFSEGEENDSNAE